MPNHEKRQFSLIIPSQTMYLDVVHSYIAEILRFYKISRRNIKKLVLAIDEAITNIIEHGLDFDGEHLIEIDLNIEWPYVEFVLEDDAIQFNPLTYELNLDTFSYEHPKEGGLGIFLIKQVMDELKYNHLSNGKNHFSMKKNLSVYLLNQTEDIEDSEN